jgi:hypothetical protein
LHCEGSQTRKGVQNNIKEFSRACIFYLECHWKIQEFPNHDKSKSRWSEVLGAMGFAGKDHGHLLFCQMRQGWSCLGTEIQLFASGTKGEDFSHNDTVSRVKHACGNIKLWGMYSYSWVKRKLEPLSP